MNNDVYVQELNNKSELENNKKRLQHSKSSEIRGRRHSVIC